MDLSSQMSYQADSNAPKPENSRYGRSTSKEWTNQDSKEGTVNDDVNKKVWSQQIHGPGAAKENMDSNAKQSGSSAQRSLSGTSGSSGSGGGAATKSGPTGTSDVKESGTNQIPPGQGKGRGEENQKEVESGKGMPANNQPKGSSGKTLPGKGLGNSGKGPETYAREEDDSIPAEDTGTPTKDKEKKSDE